MARFAPAVKRTAGFCGLCAPLVSSVTPAAPGASPKAKSSPTVAPCTDSGTVTVSAPVSLRLSVIVTILRPELSLAPSTTSPSLLPPDAPMVTFTGL